MCLKNISCLLGKIILSLNIYVLYLISPVLWQCRIFGYLRLKGKTFFIKRCLIVWESYIPHNYQAADIGSFTVPLSAKQFVKFY